MGRKKMLLLTGDCTAKGCKRRSIAATKLGDFWVEICADHQGKEFTLDLNKVGLYVAEGSIGLRPATRGKCRYCGCTDDKPCDEGCSWIEPTLTVCSNFECVKKLEAMCEAAQL
jgi:hypothetical protein